MVSRRELVDQAIRFTAPHRVPVVYWNCDQTDGDVMLYHLALGCPGDGDPRQNAWDWSTNEWGYRLESLEDGTMGHPVKPYYPELPDPREMHAPALREEERMAAAPGFFAQCEDRYRLASFDLSGFTVYTLLRGFENSMQDLLQHEATSAALLDRIMQFECDLMALAARHGFHGVHFADDWGTQSGLVISPALWRRFFRPRYERQFTFAHRLGLTVWFHSCGNIGLLTQDFHQMGVDVLNIAQPNVVDLDAVGAKLRGQQCFMMPISYQTTSIQGTPEEIAAEAQRMFELLGTSEGGFIGYVEEYGCMGMTRKNYLACGEAFRRLDPRRLRTMQPAATNPNC